jgi:hypothetical protein
MVIRMLDPHSIVRYLLPRLEKTQLYPIGEQGVLKDLRRPVKEQITECTFSPSDPAVLACSSEDKSGRYNEVEL